MLIKMRESKGFTLVELMIVVAIIGILAAVAVPYYQRYVQKARLTSLVWPGMHSIQTNIAAFYAMRNSFPDSSQLNSFIRDADTTYMGSLAIDGTAQTLTFRIRSAAADSALHQLDGRTLIATATISNEKITNWVLSGSLADELGLR